MFFPSSLVLEGLRLMVQGPIQFLVGDLYKVRNRLILEGVSVPKLFAGAPRRSKPYFSMFARKHWLGH